MNGRSFQTLIQLTPGVALTANAGRDNGQFSVNGQRASSNYWMVDGVSANIGVGAGGTVLNPGNGVAGTLGAFTALGGTNSLVSVDAMQEFRIQTSTYAPEFGRTPGAQISIVTRSGTNQFHGTLFEYFRNDVLDANDWFADSKGLPKPRERQNDFGGTFSGPILKDRTFFFFSYEGLRLRLPQVALTTVPDLLARQSAIPAVQPFLNAFPIPNGPDNTVTGVAQFNASFSNSSTLDAYSIRVDHKLNKMLALFVRYNYSPSDFVQRAATSVSANTVRPISTTMHTGTAGGTWTVSPFTVNDVHFNYSRVDSTSHQILDNFGGAIPLSSLPIPSPFTSENANFSFGVFSLSNGNIAEGALPGTLQRQINIVDNLSLQRGRHSLKIGVDFRRLSPVRSLLPYGQVIFFSNVGAAQTGSLLFAPIQSGVEGGGTLLFRNLGSYVEDTWRVAPRLTLTYGLRWDVDFVPSATHDPRPVAVTGFDLTNLSQLALAPSGTPIFSTRYGNVAPRIGVAYQMRQDPAWGTVVRGGFGIFYDLSSSEVGTALASGVYPFGAAKTVIGPGAGGTATFPLTPSDAAPPPIAAIPSNLGLFASDPKLNLPYTLQWNVAVEQSVGKDQTVSASYIGAVGRRLLQTVVVSRPNTNFNNAMLVTNSGTSDYHALQVQAKRRLSQGLQVLASYTWSHSIDTASAGSYGAGSNFGSNTLVPSIGSNANRGPSDFDIRHAFSTGLTYEIPSPKVNPVAHATLGGWSLESVIQVRSAPPVNVFNSRFSTLAQVFTQIRPDLVPGIPLYLFGPQYPGGKILNNTPNQGGSGCLGPFCPPPTSGGIPLRQGNLGRNALRGFGATQWDFAVHRDFPIHETLKLQFRAEMFNVLNHPNFGQPVGNLATPSQFGQSIQMLNQFLAGGQLGGGAFSPLYQIGGPRSVQFALKMIF